jgi:hypothetical protein
MDDFKLHVERIVRPVRATQSRKLRMRRELLAHLHAALAEERTNSPDEATAIERAKQRLGTPEELSRTLHQSVPLVHRILFAKVEPGKTWAREGPFERWEMRLARRLWALSAPMTLWHSFIMFFAAAVVPYFALLVMAWTVPPQVYLRNLVERPTAAVIVNLIITTLTLSLFVICGRLTVLVSENAAPLSPPLARRALRYIATIFAIPFSLMYLCVSVIAQRALTPAHLGRATVVSVSLALSMYLVGRLLSTLRRPYDEWLTLDIAGT